jgi:O-antigen ligase
MNVIPQQLNINQWEGVSSHPRSEPFWLPLLAMLLLSLSFIDIFTTGVNDLKGASDMAGVKFSMHIVAYAVMGFVFFRYCNGKISNSSDLKLYVAYCAVVMLSVFVYAFRADDISTVMFIRAFDLALFSVCILVFLKLKIEDSFRITLIAMSLPVFILLAIYPFSPDLAMNHFSADTGYLPRLGGKVLHPNLLGACAAISLIMLMGTKARIPVKVVLGLIFFLAVLFSQSRTALLALILAFIGSFLLARGSFAFKVAAGFVLTLVMVMVVLGYQSGVGSDIQTRSMDNVNTLSGRTDLWGIALTEYLDGNLLDFLFGLSPFFATKSFYVIEGWQPSSLHNTYLHVLVGFGIIAAVFYTVMLLRFLRIKASEGRLTFSFRTLVLYILLTGLTEQTVAVKLDYFTIMLPLIMAQCYQLKYINDTEPNTHREDLT